jgi:arylamine N-acetyltransferase
MESAYSPSQLTKYLKYIALPAHYEPYINEPHSFPKTEEALTTLFRCQITRFPYDNLTVHYSTDNTVDIHPNSIYTKFLGTGETEPSGRGGYCLECSIIFHHILRGLGFSVYMTGVRNRERIDGIPQGEFKGW